MFLIIANSRLEINQMLRSEEDCVCGIMKSAVLLPLEHYNICIFHKRNVLMLVTKPLYDSKFPSDRQSKMYIEKSESNGCYLGI